MLARSRFSLIHLFAIIASPWLGLFHSTWTRRHRIRGALPRGLFDLPGFGRWRTVRPNAVGAHTWTGDCRIVQDLFFSHSRRILRIWVRREEFVDLVFCKQCSEGLVENLLVF